MRPMKGLCGCCGSMLGNYRACHITSDSNLGNNFLSSPPGQTTVWMFHSALKMCPAAAEINPKPDALETVSVLTKKPKTSVEKKPPMKPSQVFFGDSCRR